MLLYFCNSHNNLDRLVFIDLQWIYGAVARIITLRKHVQSLPVKNGILPAELLPAIFRGKGVNIPPEWQNAILSVLEMFHIAVALDRERSTYLIPALLPATRSRAPGSRLSARPVREAIVRKYLLAYVPGGFWSHLISLLFIFLSKDVDVKSASSQTEVRVDDLTASICISRNRLESESVSCAPVSPLPSTCSVGPVSSGIAEDLAADWLSSPPLDGSLFPHPSALLQQTPSDVLASWDTVSRFFFFYLFHLFFSCHVEGCFIDMLNVSVKERRWLVNQQEADSLFLLSSPLPLISLFFVSSLSLSLSSLYVHIAFFCLLRQLQPTSLISFRRSAACRTQTAFASHPGRVAPTPAPCDAQQLHQQPAPPCWHYLLKVSQAMKFQLSFPRGSVEFSFASFRPRPICSVIVMKSSRRRWSWRLCRWSSCLGNKRAYSCVCGVMSACVLCSYLR